MRFYVKKLIIYGLLSVFISFSFAACFDPPDVTADDPPVYTNVEYSEDGKSVTIYLDGSMPVPANRALNKPLAELGYDYFEVVFLYKESTSTNRIVRADWELGEPAGVSGVYRTATGVDYYDTSVTNPIDTSTVPVGSGLAVLFVGCKADKALLAVGTLSHINNGTNVLVTDPSNPLITVDTSKVTFALNALKAGISTTVADSSFKTTSFAQDPQLKNILGKIGGKDFPYFYLPTGSSSITATYTFSVHSPTTHPYAFYQPAIIYAGNAAAVLEVPHWTYPPNIEKSEAVYPYSENTTVSITYPATSNVGQSFNGTVNFSINTAAYPPPAESICALLFRIPVYAVSSAENPITWYIKPSFGNYYRELDNGGDGTGGAVLLGVGVTGGTLGERIEIRGTPQKYYPPNNLVFNIAGLQFIYRLDLVLTDITPAPNVNSKSDVQFFYDSTYPYDSDYDPDSDVTDPAIYGPVTPIPVPLTFNSTFYEQKVTIRVVYTKPGGGTISTTYEIEVNGSIPVDIPYYHRIFLAKTNDFTDVQNRINAEGGAAPINNNWLLIFTENVNISSMAFNLKAPTVIYIIANTENIIVGRNGTSAISNNGNYHLDIYIGSWPFNDPVFAGGDVVTNQPFNINAGGTWQNFSGAATATTTMFTGTNITVTALSNINIANRARLGP